MRISNFTQVDFQVMPELLTQALGERIAAVMKSFKFVTGRYIGFERFDPNAAVTGDGVGSLILPSESKPFHLASNLFGRFDRITYSFSRDFSGNCSDDDYAPALQTWKVVFFMDESRANYRKVVLLTDVPAFINYEAENSEQYERRLLDLVARVSKQLAAALRSPAYEARVLCEMSDFEVRTAFSNDLAGFRNLSDCIPGWLQPIHLL